jgi:ribosomal protein L7/L12
VRRHGAADPHLPQDLVLAGQRINAIKAAGELCGYDLADAKRLVEGLVEN